MRPEDIRGKKVLISPLNWGMGHVSRCIGLIHQLQAQENDIIVACDAEQEQIFRWYFQDLTILRHEGYPFDFGGKGNFGWDLAKKLGTLKKRLKQEVKETEELVKKMGVQLVLSDHRYGFYSSEVPSVFITHQYHLPVSKLQLTADQWHKKRMKPFHHIWLLDYNDSKLSGKLTLNIEDDRAIFIGPYSRFSFYDALQSKSEDFVVVISGPHVYAQKLADQMSKEFPEGLFVCSEAIDLDASIRRISGNWKEQDTAILKAQRLISRSGYSTIMDLEILKIPALLFPTPGQAEQLYLHDRLTDCSEYKS